MQEFIFTTSFDTETKGNDLYLDGFISTTEKDLVDDVITVKCLESMKSQILERNIKLDLEHEAFRGADNEEKEINKTIIPVGRLTDATIENNKLRIKAKINPHHKRYDETKGSIQGQYLDAFSIAYIPTKVSQEVKDGEQIRLLDDVILLNVALTGNPVNTGAQIREIMIKSMDSIKSLPKQADEKIPTSTEEQENDEDDEEEKKRIKRGKIIEDYKSDEANKDLLEVKTQLKYKYAKRTGSPGKYKYWYRNPKTGKLEAGKKPSDGNQKRKSEVTHAIRSVDNQIDALDKLERNFKEGREAVDKHAFLSSWLRLNLDKMGDITDETQEHIDGLRETLESTRDELQTEYESFGKEDDSNAKRKKEELIEYLRNKHDKLIEQGKEERAKKVLEKIEALDRIKLKSNSHSEITTKKEDNKMSKETQIKDEAVEDVVESTESTESAEPEASLSEESDNSEALAEEVKALKEEVAKLIESNLKTQSKSISEQAPEVKNEIKSVEPLDVIR